MTDDEMDDLAERACDEAVERRGYSCNMDVWRAIAAAARAEAIEECAKKIEPKNSVEDWTEYAQARSDAASDLRAMLKTGEKT